ncbi:hypothetical protein RRG08_021715 [Elysia crispata]|uniref:Uncharacterized protein n=1 Tax=Elysia crispata TaxID=231223 RepID=A0AAE1DQ29_9GAST|nr:hypothetical protein RRG08_021715 [Elysia crispata]
MEDRKLKVEKLDHLNVEGCGMENGGGAMSKPKGVELLILNVRLAFASNLENLYLNVDRIRSSFGYVKQI